MSSSLPDRQRRLRDLLLGKGDVAISDLFAAMRTETTPEYETVPAKQRWLSPYITSLNRNLVEEGLRVEPGGQKATYRLVAHPPSP